MLWLTLITMLLPTSALVLPLFMELNLVHLVNTPWAVILPACFFPFGVYLTYIYYKSSLPSELMDAARVDGASEFDIFIHIALPLAKPLLGLLAFISFNANWNNYFGPYVLLNDDKLFTLPVGIQTVLGSTSALQPGFNPNPGAHPLPVCRSRGGWIDHDRAGCHHFPLVTALCCLWRLHWLGQRLMHPDRERKICLLIRSSLYPVIVLAISGSNMCRSQNPRRLAFFFFQIA